MESKNDYQRERNRKLHEAGLCIACRKPLSENETGMRCAECNAKMIALNKARYQALKGMGRCVTCSVKLPDGWKYGQCKKCMAKKQRRNEQNHEEYLSKGLCTYCGGEREDKTYVLCEACRQKLRERRRMEKERWEE